MIWSPIIKMIACNSVFQIWGSVQSLRVGPLARDQNPPCKWDLACWGTFQSCKPTGCSFLPEVDVQEFCELWILQTQKHLKMGQVFPTLLNHFRPKNLCKSSGSSVHPKGPFVPRHNSRDVASHWRDLRQKKRDPLDSPNQIQTESMQQEMKPSKISKTIQNIQE